VQQTLVERAQCAPSWPPYPYRDGQCSCISPCGSTTNVVTPPSTWTCQLLRVMIRAISVRACESSVALYATYSDARRTHTHHTLCGQGPGRRAPYFYIDFFVISPLRRLKKSVLDGLMSWPRISAELCSLVCCNAPSQPSCHLHYSKPTLSLAVLYCIF
jgi:hypothetical protein